jgi:dipeptidyl aminopeptidase/acylaminoacyl peptidase
VDSNRIGVVGFSLGAAISLLTAAKEPAIKAVVSDTTYANISDLIVQEVDRTTSLPKWIIPIFEPGSILVANLIYKIKIDELVPEQSVGDIKYPILIIHGKEDTRIPFEHSVRVHANAHPDSDIWLVPNVEHIDSFLTYPEEYTNRLADYFRNQLAYP